MTYKKIKWNACVKLERDVMLVILQGKFTYHSFEVLELTKHIVNHREVK